MITYMSVGDKLIKLKMSAGVLLRYKEQFGVECTDEYNEISKMIENNADKMAISEKIIRNAKRMLFCMSNADADMLSVTLNDENIKEINEIFYKSLPKDNKDNSSSTSFSSEKFTAICLECGLTMQDIDNYSLKFIMNIITEHINLHKTSNKDNVRMATQADIDRL